MHRLKSKVLLLIVCLLTSSALVRIAPLTLSQGETTVFIDPPELDVIVGNNFIVNLKIANVMNLSYWDLKISFDPNLMNCTSAEEGPFLRRFGATLWPTPIIDNEAGTIPVSYTHLTLPTILLV